MGREGTNIIVEAPVPPAERFQVLERIVRREILKLNHELRHHVLHCCHEFLHELFHLLDPD